MKISIKISCGLMMATAMTLSSCGGGGSSAPAATAPVGGGGSATPVNTSSITLAKSGDILVNQHGYVTKNSKIASLVETSQTALDWKLIDGSDRIYASGKTTYKGMSALSGLSLHEIDFSEYQRVASGLRLQVRTNKSQAFAISDRPYSKIAKDSARYFYQSRAAAPVEDAYVTLAQPPLSRAAGHTQQDLTCFSGTDLYGTVWPSCGISKTINGGWYDAGDYGLYAVNSGAALWTMQNLYERLIGENSACKVSRSATGQLDIPESDNTIHDILDEARIGMELLLSLQVDTDTPIALALGSQIEGDILQITQQSARGMVHHKVHGSEWPKNNALPSEDIQARYLYPPSTAATLHLAATGAQCARVWRGIDNAFADRCLVASTTAYEAAKSTPNAFAYDNFDGGGPYSDQALTDEFSWAATELFLTTDNLGYGSDVWDYTAGGYDTHSRVQPSWIDTQPFGMLSIAAQYVKDPSRTPRVIEQEALAGLNLIAQQYAQQVDTTGFNVPDDNSNYYWGSNANLVNRAMMLASVTGLPSGEDYSDQVTAVMDYLLGHNPLSQSYITGFGDQSVEQLHHRFWSYSIDRNRPKPPAGLLSGGPNNTSMVDPVSSQLTGQCRAQTCWVDDYEAYAFNEVSLSWNAGLVWVSNWIDSEARTCGG